MRFNRLLLLGAAALIGVGTPGPASAAAKPSWTDLMRPMNTLVHAINTLAPSAPSGVFEDHCDAMDEFTPFVWDASGGCTRWYADLVGTSPKIREEMRALNIQVTLGGPRFLFADGQSAYFEIPSAFTFNVKGKANRETGEWAVIERRTGDTWEIAAHAWATTSDTAYHR